MARKRSMTIAVFISGDAKSFDTLSELSIIKGPNDNLDIIVGLDIQKLEMYLNEEGKRVDVVHLIAHGDSNVLQFDKGVSVTESDLVALFEPQKCNLKFIVISACDSYDTGLALHNALQVPVVAYNGPIEDRAAISFARVFYMTIRAGGSLDSAVQRGRDSLAITYPAESRKVRVINGQMLTAATVGTKIDLLERNQQEMHETMLSVNAAVLTLTGELAEMRNDLKNRGQLPPWIVLLALTFLAITALAQVATPFLNRLVYLWLK